MDDNKFIYIIMFFLYFVYNVGYEEVGRIIVIYNYFLFLKNVLILVIIIFK